MLPSRVVAAPAGGGMWRCCLVPQQPEENIGVVDAYLRLLGGFALLALGMGRKLGRASSFLAILLGASKVAEGITRYCPLYDLLDLTSADGTVRRIERPRANQAHGQREAEEGPTRRIVERTFPWDEELSAPGPEAGSLEAGGPESHGLGDDAGGEPEPKANSPRRPVRRVVGRVWRDRPRTAEKGE